MNPIFESTFWGFVSGGALVIGAAVGYFARVPGSVVAGVMAFGSGVLISALSFELMEEAFEEAGLTATATGFLLGAAIYAAANHLLSIWGARHRKRSGTQQPSEEDQAGSGVDRRRCVDRWHPRIDRDRAEHTSRRCGERGHCCGHLSVKPSRGAIELGWHAKSRTICGLCFWCVDGDRRCLRPGVTRRLRGIWCVTAFYCCCDDGRRGGWHVGDDRRHHDPRSRRRNPRLGAPLRGPGISNFVHTN